MALIIVEGCDCTGKTTIVNELRDIFERESSAPVRVIHAGPPTKPSLEEYEASLFDYHPGEEHLILDRWHWGERVYPLVLNRSTDLDGARWLHLELFMQSRGALVIHLTNATEKLRACLEERGDDLIKPDMLALIRLKFLEVERSALTRFYRFSGSNALWHNVKLRERVLLNVVNEALNLEREVDRIHQFVTYVGPPEPDVLLLGDVRGGDPATHGDIPAFYPTDTSSGHYLLDTLRRLDPGVNHFGVANACDVDDALDLWETLGRPTTIALGANAHDRTFTFTQHVYHPQYWRRFKHHEQVEYAKEILTAIERGRVVRGGVAT